jgi:cell division septation protein DedD
MRDTDRLKEKLEITLDSRQLFFLVFGGAVLACLVFVVGVMTGKRLESRQAKKQRPTAALDELASVDEDSKLTGKGLTFHDELVKPDSRTLTNVPKEVEEWKHMGQAPKAAPKAEPAQGKGKGKAEARPADAPPQAEAKAEANEVAPEPAKPAKKYTLQVSAFQSKAEANELVKKLQGQGLRPYLSATAVPNKGTWYRVRVGTYPSKEKAADAKRKFESELNLTAYISRR